MSMLSKTLCTSSALIALILMPTLASAPTILSSSPNAHRALQQSHRDLARTLHQLRLEERNLKMNRPLALDDEKYVTIDPQSFTFRMNWGTALLKEGGFHLCTSDQILGGITHVSSKDPHLPPTMHLTNGVTIHTKITHNTSPTPCIYLEQEDLQAIFDFLDIGSKVIWELQQ